MTAYGRPVYTERLDDGLSVLVRPLSGVGAAATCLHFGVVFGTSQSPAGRTSLSTFAAVSRPAAADPPTPGPRWTTPSTSKSYPQADLGWRCASS
jgi:hypothetical protein